MKKKIAAALAATFALGVTSAFAANPFSDVEAKHWAYDSVSKLAKAGIIDGYGDGTFRGDRTMTRYEMAQIVAKAMARSDKANAEQKAMINKLSAEFSAELNNLGVRVGALEKKVGTIKLTGDARVRYVNNTDEMTPSKSGAKFSQRLRLNMNADVNENTGFYGRIIAMDHNAMGDAGTKDRLRISDAAFTTKNALGMKDSTVTVGRFSQKMLPLGNWIDTTGMVDGIKITTGDKLKATLGYADFTAAGKTAEGKILEQAYFLDLSYATSKATTIGAMFLKENSSNSSANDYKVWGVGFKSQFTKDFYMFGEYTKNMDSKISYPAYDNAAGYVMRLGYKGANAKVPGSWGASVDYYKYEPGANIGDFSTSSVMMENIKGWDVCFNYAPAKNMTFEAFYQFNAKRVTDPTKEYKRTRVQLNYFF